MAVNRNIKVPFASPYFIITSLLLITSVVTFLGICAAKYEFSTLFGSCFEDYLEIPVLVIIAGSVLVFGDACLGLITLIHRWYLGVLTFFVCTGCLLVTILGLATLVYIHSDTIVEAVFSRLEIFFKNHEINIDAIDALQLGLKCCGYESPDDWKNETGKNIPESCCIDDHCDTENSWEIHSTGCYRAMSLFLDIRKWIVVVVLAVLVLMKIAAIMLSALVCKHFPRESTRGDPSNATDNSAGINATLPRVNNPFGQSSSVPSVDNNRMSSRSYVRRPTQLTAAGLNYQSPHESFLRQPPQLRFDRRVMMPSSKLKNPYATRPL